MKISCTILLALIICTNQASGQETGKVGKGSYAIQGQLFGPELIGIYGNYYANLTAIYLPFLFTIRIGGVKLKKQLE